MLSPEQLCLLRQDTLGCQDIIHFNNAGSALQPHTVVRTVQQYLETEEVKGGYETASKYQEQLNQFYSEAAKLIGAEPDEIAFMSSASHAWLSALGAIEIPAGSNIICSDNDYGSNEMALSLLKSKGVQLRVIPSDEQGKVELNKLEEAVDQNTALVAMTYLPSCNGLINNIQEMGQLLSDKDCLFLVDACQAIGHLPVNVKELGCDLLAATGRKYLRAPRGTGFLYVKEELLSELHPSQVDIHGGGMQDDAVYYAPSAKRFELFEHSPALKLGLTEALNYANQLNMKDCYSWLTYLADRLRFGLKSLNGFEVVDIGENCSGIICGFHKEIDSNSLQAELKTHKINVSISEKSSGYGLFERYGWPDLIRLSVHYYNTEAEVDHCLEIMEQILISRQS